MTNKAFLEFARLSIFIITGVSGAIIQRPLNVATSIGGQTVFNCSSDATGAITWLYTTDCNAASGTSLTENTCDLISSYASHYRAEKPGGFVCNLIVFDAVLSLGGCYACADGFGTGRLYQAMLIIVDSNAIITTNSTEIIPGEDVMISNSVSYRGPSMPLQPPPLPPSFYWTLKSDSSQNISSYTGLTTNTSASSYIVVTAQQPNVPPHLCNLFFNSPIYVPTSCAANAPTYSRSWETPTYPVSFPSENLTISGNSNPCLYEPVVMTCNASGHPPPTYKWFNLANGDVLSESSSVTIQLGGSYQCTASNIIRNVPYSTSKVVDVYVCLNMWIFDPVCTTVLVILNLLSFTGFILYYALAESGRTVLNDSFPWLNKMLPCMNDRDNLQLNERNGSGSKQKNTSGTKSSTNSSKAPASIAPPPTPPPPLETIVHSHQDPRNRAYPQSNTPQRPSLHSVMAGPYHQDSRNQSPGLSTGGIIYAELGPDNQPRSRKPVQPVQTDATTYASIGMA